MTILLIIILSLTSGCGNTHKMQTQQMDEKAASNEPDSLAIATFGGGCFWCTEAIFDQLQGVYEVESGYAGGDLKNPTYEQICSGQTGHAEVIQIKFDPTIITYAELLEVFWTTHDPTTLNRQGNDVGTQYRSVVFYHNDEQKEMAQNSLKSVGQKLWDNPIVTEISPIYNYFSAEKYHQEYYENNPNQGYCRVIIAPKVQKFRKKFQEKLKPEYK